jgi:hypothetical protein
LVTLVTTSATPTISLAVMAGEFME